MPQPNDTITFHEVACFSIRKSNILLIFDPHNGISMNFPPPNGKNLVSNSESFVLEEADGYYEFKGIQIHGTKVKHGDFENCGYCIVYSVKEDPIWDLFLIKRKWLQ